MKFFIADTHFHHKLAAIKRGFSCIEEMDEALINNWNAKVKKGDHVYIAGDFSFDECLTLLGRLNGHKFLTPGDHDSSALRCSDQFVKIDKILIVREQKQNIVVSHWPFWIWPRSHYGAWHVHGHTHDSQTPNGKCHNVGVDSNNFAPVSFEELSAIMEERPENPNLLK